MSEDASCLDPRYQPCPPVFNTLKTGWSRDYTHTQSQNRTVLLRSGAMSITIQSRKRDFRFHEDQLQYNDFIRLIRPSIDYSIVGCDYTYSSDSNVDFKESYETVDSQLMYLDLRNDTAVVREVKDRSVITDGENDAPSDRIEVFTGFETQLFFPFVFNEGIPIDETVRYVLHTGATKTTLHSEDVVRAYPFSNILMPTFPTSPWGIHFNDKWADETEWYRQDQRKDSDGDASLFWPDWCQSMGKLAQELDKLNRDLMVSLRLGWLKENPHSNNRNSVEISEDHQFRGSVAYDVDKNMFFSIAVPNHYYATDPDMVLTSKLIIDGVEQEIPTDSETDVWFPISPV